MATTFRTSGNYVYINNVRFAKNSLLGEEGNNGWVLRGDPLANIANNLDFDTAIDESTGEPFDNETDFLAWLHNNILRAPGSDSGEGVQTINGTLVTGTAQNPIVNIPTDDQIQTVVIGVDGGPVTESLQLATTGLGQRVYALEQSQDDNIILGGQDADETFTFGTTNEHGVNLLVNGNPHMIVTEIGNFGFNVATAPEVPFMVGGGIWTQAGAVQGQMSPYSGTELSVGTISNHPLLLTANGNTLLTISNDGSLTSAGDLHMSEKKIINIADGSDPRDAVNFQQLGAVNTDLQAHKLVYGAGFHVPPQGTQGQILVKGADNTIEWSDASITSENYGTPAIINNGNPVDLDANSGRVYVIDTNVGNTAVNLPATPETGRLFTIKNTETSANGITINGNGNNIDGQATINITTMNGFRTVIFDGSHWRVIGSN